MKRKRKDIWDEPFTITQGLSPEDFGLKARNWRKLKKQKTKPQRKGE